jgi:hypothetical protein
MAGSSFKTVITMYYSTLYELTQTILRKANMAGDEI